MKTRGRYGESLSGSAKTLRAGGADVSDGAVRKMLEDARNAAEAPLLSARANVRTARDAYKPNAEALAEKKIIDAVRAGDATAERAARAELAALNVPGAKQNYKDSVKALRERAGGLGGMLGPITAGEGNRISGALAGGALGAGAGAGLAKLAPQATQNLAQYGKIMGNAGKMTAKHSKGVNATFSSATRPLGKLNTDMANFAKANRGLAVQGPVQQGAAALGTANVGMSGSQAALMGTGLVGGAGILGGATTGGGGNNQS
jgi:hypothetical protein